MKHETIALVHFFISAGNLKRASEILEDGYADYLATSVRNQDSELVYKKLKISIAKELDNLDEVLELYSQINLTETHESYFIMIYERVELLIHLNQCDEALGLLEAAMQKETFEVIAHGAYLLQLYSQLLQDKEWGVAPGFAALILSFHKELGVDGYEPDTSGTKAAISTIEELMWRESDSSCRFGDLHENLKESLDKAGKTALLERFMAEEPLAYYRAAAEAIDQSDW